MENERQGSWIKGWRRLSDGGKVDREVIQVLCNLFLKLNKQRLEKLMT